MTGRCLCGGVTFSLSEPPVSAGYCHCTRCVRRTGSAFAVGARTAPESVSVEDPDGLLGSWNAGDGWDKLFCTRCGAHLFSRNPEDGAMSVRFGAFDGDPGIRPGDHQFTADAPAWAPVADDGLPRYPERRPAA